MNGPVSSAHTSAPRYAAADDRQTEGQRGRNGKEGGGQVRPSGVEVTARPRAESNTTVGIGDCDHDRLVFRRDHSSVWNEQLKMAPEGRDIYYH
jgi:hypothetical protein